MGVLSFVILNQLTEAIRERRLTLVYQQNLTQLLSDVKDAETGQRGYIITGKDSFLEPYKAALAKIDEGLEIVKQDIQILPQKDPLYQELVRLIRLKLVELDKQIITRREEDFRTAVQGVSSEEGKRIMDSIRLVMGQMLDNAVLAIKQKDQQANDFIQYAFITNILEGLLALALVSFYSYLFYRDSHQLTTTKFQLDQTLELYRAILDSSKHMLITTDSTGLITSFNKGAEKTLGYKVSEVVNKKSILDFYDKEEVKEKGRYLTQKSHQTKNEFDILVASSHYLVWSDSDWLIKRKNALTFMCEQTVSALRDEKNDIQGYLFSWKDISEQKSKSEELKTLKGAIETKQLKTNRLNASLEHELRLSLNSMTNLIHLLAKNTQGHLKEQEMSYIARIAEGSQTLANLINQMIEPVSQKTMGEISRAETIPTFNRPLNILAIDNDPDFRQILMMYFTQLGCHIITAETGEEGLKLAKENPIDLIIMDMLMSPMNGYDVAKQVLNDKKLKSIPFAFISIVAKEIQGKIPGSLAFISKPINISDLKHLLHQFALQKKS